MSVIVMMSKHENCHVQITDRPGFQLQPASGFQVKSKFTNFMNMKHFKLVKDTNFRSALLTLSSDANSNVNRRNANIFHNIQIQAQTQIQIPIVGVKHSALRTSSTTDDNS